MKNPRNFSRIVALLLSLMLLIGMVPAFAAAQDTREKLLIDLREANKRSELYKRHASNLRHEDAYSGGELFFSSDMYITAESAYYFFGEDYVCYITPTRWIDYFTDEGVGEILMLPEEYAAKLENYQGYIEFTDVEKLVSCEEQGDELLITTKFTDADEIRAYVEKKQGIYGDDYQTDYDVAELVLQYRADADLTVKDLIETLRLADGSELPLSHTTFAYDAPTPDPAAADSVLAPAFDESAGMKQITVVFASGTPEERTCQYSVPVNVPAYVQYQGEIVDMYEDAECTQPTKGREGRTEFTVYVKGNA